MDTGSDFKRGAAQNRGIDVVETTNSINTGIGISPVL